MKNRSRNQKKSSAPASSTNRPSASTKLLPLAKPAIPKKYQPHGFEILHEDLDLIIGCKKAGILSVAALWEKTNTVHQALKKYVRKGSPQSRKDVYVVHRLDQATSGVMVYAKSEGAQQFLKSHWSTTDKYYLAIVHGHFENKKGLIKSYLQEDEDYFVQSTKVAGKGQLAQTKYEVMRESANYSLVKVHLLTGKKNQIRVHMAEAGHSILGDDKYFRAARDLASGEKLQKPPTMKSKTSAPILKSQTRGRSVNAPRSGPLMLHSYSLELTHPFKGQRIRVVAEAPPYFRALFDGPYE